jgi:hypothetical protein
MSKPSFVRTASTFVTLDAAEDIHAVCPSPTKRQTESTRESAERGTERRHQARRKHTREEYLLASSAAGRRLPSARHLPLCFLSALVRRGFSFLASLLLVHAANDQQTHWDSNSDSQDNLVRETRTRALAGSDASLALHACAIAAISLMRRRSLSLQSFMQAMPSSPRTRPPSSNEQSRSDEQPHVHAGSCAQCHRGTERYARLPGTRIVLIVLSCFPSTLPPGDLQVQVLSRLR